MNKIYKITDKQYEDIRNNFNEVMKGVSFYYSGDIKGETDGIKYSLPISIFLYRDEVTKEITNYSVVWWDIHMYKYNMEVETDFELSTLLNIDITEDDDMCYGDDYYDEDANLPFGWDK